VEDYFFDGAAGDAGAEDVAELVDYHHDQPT